MSARMDEWQALGTAYPKDGTPAVRAAFDVLAPVSTYHPTIRCPVYEDGHETTPTPEEVWKLAEEIAQAVLRAPEE